MDENTVDETAVASTTETETASEPVPVTVRNPAAMLMGFQLGAAIRRMRK